MFFTASCRCVSVTPHFYLFWQFTRFYILHGFASYIFCSVHVSHFTSFYILHDFASYMFCSVNVLHFTSFYIPHGLHFIYVYIFTCFFKFELFLHFTCLCHPKNLICVTEARVCFRKPN